MSADPDGHPIRLSLSLPGAASLGAYQAGATAAVAVVVEELRRSGRDVRIDAIGGVSAGAMVALFLAHSLITGSDASRTLHDAWVDDVDATLLRSRSSQAPLDFTQLERRLRHELESPPDGGGRADLRRQYSPVGLHIGLTNLLGLTYSVETGGSPLSAMSFVDWGRFILDPDDGPRQLVSPEGRSPVDFALASAAHPLAFAPRMLDRSQDRQAYEDNGISNVPESGALWYSDGGLVESAPVGRTLEAAHTVAGPAAGLRMHLVIDPRSSGPSGSSRWGRGDDPPSWLAGVRRAMSVLPSQALHEDLRRIASTNDRLTAIDGVVRAIGDRLGDDGDGTLRRQLAATCRHPVDSEASMAEVLRRTLEDLAGVSGMEQVRIDTISPLLLARESGHPVPGLLAGDIVGAFGGFLSHRLRRSDFALGWASTIAWTRDGFTDFDVDDHVVEHIREVLHERRSESWDEVNAGQWDVSRLDRRARLDLARLAAHVGRIVAMELLPAAVAGRPRRRSRTHGDDGRRS